MAPVLSFTAEEVWQYLHGSEGEDATAASVHLQEFPTPLPLPENPGLVARWDTLVRVREEVLKQLEVARAEGHIGNSLEAAVTLEAEGDMAPLLRRHLEDLPALFIVSKVQLERAGGSGFPSSQWPGLRIAVTRARGEKCERCWMYTEDRGRDPGFPGLCLRCVGVIREIQGGRKP